MRRVARRVANVLLWLAAAIGVASGGLWLANVTGLVQPLVVVSGSMEPAIMTGDLLLATRVQVAEVSVGEVLTLPSTVTGKLVTHRVLSITEVDGHHEIIMKGDANEAQDGEVYQVAQGGSVWRQALNIPGAGRVVMAMGTPGVAIPLLIALGALIVLTMLPTEPVEEPAAGEDDQPDETGPDD